MPHFLKDTYRRVSKDISLTDLGGYHRSVDQLLKKSGCRLTVTSYRQIYDHPDYDYVRSAWDRVDRRLQQHGATSFFLARLMLSSLVERPLMAVTADADKFVAAEQQFLQKAVSERRPWAIYQGRSLTKEDHDLINQVEANLNRLAITRGFKDHLNGVICLVSNLTNIWYDDYHRFSNVLTYTSRPPTK